MYDSAAGADLDLPLIRRMAAHRFTQAQLVAMDAVLVTLIIVIFHVLLARQQARVSGTAWEVIGWIGYIVAAVATLFRRRFPRATLALVLPIVVVAMCLRAGNGIPFYVALALYSVVAVSSRRAALVVLSLVAGALLAATIVGGGEQVVPASIGGVTVMLLGWLAGEHTRASRVYASQQAERAEQVSQALAEERTQIARELHDIVAHAMSVIAVRSGVARMVIDTDPGQAREALTIIETTTRRSLHEMRLLVSMLRDTHDHHLELSPVPGLGDLDRLIAETATAGVAVEVDIDGTARTLSPAADLSAYRIVQEALTNVVRHAGPTRAKVQISYRPEEVIIEVVDDGPSGRVPPPIARVGSGHGLIGMRERAALFGGELAAGPDAAGFRVRANLHTTEFHDIDLQVGDGAR